ncbi:MAG TPA: tetratricopeptide repeat protein [Myxococcota bacterium]|nr:tetratricopeptide repeat protein [Myxococcota bacterium]
MPARPPVRRAAIAAGLCLLVVAGYSGVTQLELLNYDDDEYFTLNPLVNGGLRASAVLQAFTTFHAGNWHPLTWISHMVDVSLFGLTPEGPHVVNAAIHALNAVLAFLALAELTGTTWRAALAAALFAIHPLRVESVAWIAERKDVLSMGFALAALWVWAAWARGGRRASYWGTVALCGASLLAKPTAVTFPFLLLLLDFWPLRRWHSARALGPLAREKAPFFALALASSVVTLFAQQALVRRPSLALRLENADIAYVDYLRRFLVPVDLAAMYPFRSAPETRVWVACALLLLAVTAFALAQARRRPWLIVGWLWFVGTLVPTIGIVRVGVQASADRYTYLPSLGLSLALAFAAGEAVARAPRARVAVGAVAAAVLLSFVALTRVQVATWHDMVSLFSHALEVTRSNWYAHTELGIAQAGQGEYEAARDSLEAAVRIQPAYPRALANLGSVQAELGETEAGIANLEHALAIQPDITGGRLGLAVAFEHAERLAEAEAAYRRAFDDPTTASEARLRLARLLSVAPDPALRDGAQAVALCEEVCRATPCDSPEVLDIRAMALMEAGRQDEAVATARQAAAAARARGDAQLALKLGARIVSYQSGQPLRLRLSGRAR